MFHVGRLFAFAFAETETSASRSPPGPGPVPKIEIGKAPAVAELWFSGGASSLVELIKISAFGWSWGWHR